MSENEELTQLRKIKKGIGDFFWIIGSIIVIMNYLDQKKIIYGIAFGLLILGMLNIFGEIKSKKDTSAQE